MKKLLIYGYGNPGRSDDGLGIKLAEFAKQWAIENNKWQINVETAYQLNIEDAEIISHYDYVIFSDASTKNIEGIKLSIVKPRKTTLEFTMHSMSVEYILYLCKQHFKKAPVTLLLQIQGKEWNTKEELSPLGEKNLRMAIEFMKHFYNHLFLGDLNKKYAKTMT